MSGSFWLLVVLYFAPVVIAVMRRHPQAMAIMMLDLLLGWTVIGWIAALIWSMTATGRRGLERFL